jgi:hypothetical protein
VRVRLAWLLGLAAAAAVALRALGRRRRPVADEPEPAVDRRAEDLRRRLEESRELVDERASFEEREVPVDEADPDPEARRRRVHDEGRAAVDEMRGSTPGNE